MATIFICGILLCWFSFAPVTSAIAATSGQTVEDKDVSVADGNFAEGSGWYQIPEISVGDVFAIVVSAALLLTVYSLLTTGKRGWGWMVVGFIASVFAIIGKVILSVFVEITSEYCPPDWDED